MSQQDNPSFYHPESELLQEAQEIINRKPFTSLRIGYELRNADELADIQKILETQAPDALMWGFGGSRLRNETYLKQYLRFANRYGIIPDIQISKNYSKFLSEASSGLGFGDLIDLEQIGINRKVPLFELISDIDILAVRNRTTFFNTWQRFEWNRSTVNRSGMQIDLFHISPETVINPDNDYYSNVFRESLRIKF